MPFENAIADRAGLRALYRDPKPAIRDKAIDHLDEGARRFIAAAPFVVLSTAGSGGVDASPRGGPPGFVTVLDDHRLAFGDLAGNNRLDSFANVVDRPAVGMLFLVPGLGETLRVNGRATLTTDPAVLDVCRIESRLPRLAVGVDVDECFLHCAKAFRRSRLWDPLTWPDADDRPSPTRIRRSHQNLDVDVAAVEAELETNYQATMWQVGGNA